jgi:hypothetical protein
MSLKDYMGPNSPKKDWSKEHWLQYAQTMVHSPWIDEEEKDYWRYKIEELS